MRIKRFKHFLFKFSVVRNKVYRRRFSIDSETNLNHCFLNGLKGNSIELRNAIVGEKKVIGASAVREHIKHHGKLTLKDKAFVRGGCKFLINGKGSVTLGRNSYINWDSTIATGGKASIEIGDSCAIAWNTGIIAYDFHVFNDQNYAEDIIIGDNVWIGANTTILKGAKIGGNSVIAANSLVIKGDYPENLLIAGNPAKVIKQEISWRNLTTEEKQGL